MSVSKYAELCICLFVIGGCSKIWVFKVFRSVA